MATLELGDAENATMEGTNFTAYITEIETKNTQYEQLLADVWVGVVLTLLLLSCVCCMCSCLLYHKFQQWKRSVLRNNEEPDTISNAGIAFDCESLPSYSVVSGLPSYEEALRQLQNVKRSLSCKKPTELPRQDSNVSVRQGLTRSVSRVSVLDYLQSLVQEKS